MLPAQKGLKAGHASVRKSDDGLIEDVQLIGRQRVAQLAFQRNAVAGRQNFKLGGIDPGTGPALSLGGDQRQFAILDQIEGILALFSRRQTKAAGREDLATIQAIRLGTGLRQSIAERLWRVAGIGKKKSKAVAPDPEKLRRLSQPREPL